MAGAILLLLGVAGLFADGQPMARRANVDAWENVAHLVSGALMAYVGVLQKDEVLVGIAVLPLGGAYALVGFVMPDLFGLLPSGLSVADDLLHLALGVLGVATVELSRHGRRKGRKETAVLMARTLLLAPVQRLRLERREAGNNPGG